MDIGVEIREFGACIATKDPIIEELEKVVWMSGLYPEVKILNFFPVSL